MLEPNQLAGQIDQFWEEEIIGSLSTYIEIPNKSPDFDPDWKQNGFMDKAMAHVMAWVEEQAVPSLTMTLHELPGRTPTLLLEYPGSVDDSVLIYGHLDKQPEFTGWHEGLEPWKAVRREDKLYGRGGGDDGYAIYSAIAIIKMLRAWDLPHPNITILIEASRKVAAQIYPFTWMNSATRSASPRWSLLSIQLAATMINSGSLLP